jgi:low-affinity ferrous iron transport protein
MKTFKPIFLCEVKEAAETQQVASVTNAKNDIEIVVASEKVSGYRVDASSRLVDRWLDAVVRFAGSAPVFLFILGGLLAWALMGIRFGNSDVWVAGISDVQAILCYVFDSLLMRQLLREFTEQRKAMVKLQSRCNSHYRMLLKVKNKLGAEGIHQVSEKCQNEPLQPLDHGSRAQTLFARCIIYTAKRLGHIITVGMYWVCIFIWLGFGPTCGWSDRWQLYINDATSALMVLVFAFLACLRECYADYTNICLDAIFRLDSTLESGLRRLSEDDEPNITMLDIPPRENYLQKVIYYYADIVGTLLGILFLIAVIITWAAVGPVFQFSNSWWLLIGTYAGLVGLFDSFVLRNVQNKVHQNTKNQVRHVEALDKELSAGLSVPIPVVDDRKVLSVTRRISRKMDAISSHILMVVAGFLLTIGCVIASSALRWSLTGQLISNVPPSIIETFFMLILITGQNDAEAGARVDLANIYYRRQRLLAFVKHASSYCLNHEEVEVETASDAR